MKKERLKLKKGIKEGIKTFSIITIIYLLFIAYLLFYCNRIAGLDENGYTENGHAKSMEIFKKEK